MAPINHLNYKAPGKSDATKELVGYTYEELAEMHFVCGVCYSGQLTAATVHRQRWYPPSRRLHSNSFQSAQKYETLERAPRLGPDDALDAAHRNRSKKYAEFLSWLVLTPRQVWRGLFDAEFYRHHAKITQTFIFRAIRPAGYNFVISFSHAFVPGILVTEDALNTRDITNNIGILCAHSEIYRKQ